METDYAIIGGGVVGLSVAWGLLRRGLTVTVLDGDDDGPVVLTDVAEVVGLAPQSGPNSPKRSGITPAMLCR